MDRMTPEQAAALLSRMDDLTDALHRSEEQRLATQTLAEETHGLANRLRYATWGLGLLLLLVGGGALELRSQQADIQNSRVQQCQNGNQTRDAQRTAWRELLTVSTASLEAQSAQAGVDPPKEVLDYYRAYIDWIEDDVFPDRDCSDLSKSYPEPEPAPSFEEALKASLEDGQG